MPSSKVMRVPWDVYERADEIAKDPETEPTTHSEAVGWLFEE